MDAEDILSGNSEYAVGVMGLVSIVSHAVLGEIDPSQAVQFTALSLSGALNFET